ncbi:MAG: hypothetical protein ABMB14_10450 [Myxococcota bacterium]
MRGTVPMVVGLVACGGGDAASEYAPAVLERAAVTVDLGDEELTGPRRDFAGSVTVDGSGRDWTVSVHTTGGTYDLDVHSPGGSDLSVVDGLGDAKVSIAPEPVSDELSLSIVDAEGGLVYLVEPVAPDLLTTEQFGAGFVAAGSDLGPADATGWALSLTSAMVRTDSGDVELFPGEPQEIVLDGDSFRAVLLGSYTAELLLSGNIRCEGATDRLAFELVRVAPGAADLTPLTRPDGAELPVAECGST